VKAKTTPLAKGAVIAPSVVGLGKAAAQRELTAAGLGAEFSYVVSPGPPGQVIEQSPRGGVKVKRGTTVAVAVSRGN
jgi:beta-lactam-binding protein with PASTA domain